jgi:hypothetical protein
MGFQPDALDYWISSGKTNIDKQFKTKTPKLSPLKKSTNMNDKIRQYISRSNECSLLTDYWLRR